MWVGLKTVIKISKTDQEFWQLDKPRTKLTQAIFDDDDNSTPKRYQIIITNYSTTSDYMFEHEFGDITLNG